MAEVTHDVPAIKGRRQRLEDFKSFIEKNRKSMNEYKLMSVYALESGLGMHTLKGYLKVFYGAGVWVRPNFYAKWFILTEEEYKNLQKSKGK
jgi:hypothetical protein